MIDVFNIQLYGPFDTAYIETYYSKLELADVCKTVCFYLLYR